MKIVTWNCRGLNGVNKVREVKRMIHKQGVDIICIKETKMEQVISEWVNKVGGNKLQGWCFKPFEGRSGGITSLWDKDVLKDCEILEKQFNLSVLFTQKSKGFQWVFKGVYELVIQEHEGNFFNELLSIYNRYTQP